jgi:acyl-CoA reductase-like NAD-dependent aldehyde dehydrogenase
VEHLAVIRPNGEYRSRDTELLSGVDGKALAEVSQAPALLVDETLRRMRTGRQQPFTDRLRALAGAGRLFAGSDLGGESPEEYVRSVALATGMPVAIVRTALPGLPVVLDRMAEMIDVQRPAGARFEAVGAARWVPKGDLLGVVAPSNHPMVHIEWLIALALGYRVAIRPGGRDPFTPRRLARALLASGLHPDRIAVLPGSHAAAEALVRNTDMNIVYGTESTVARYHGTPTVLTRGPGRTKALITGSVLGEDTLAALLEEIAGDGGVRCTNVSVVLCETGHRRVAEALAERLADLPVLPLLDERAVLPVHHWTTAEALRKMLESTLDSQAELLGAEPLARLSTGQGVLRPAVVRCDTPDHPALRAELPFPCVWVAPWNRADGIAAVRDSLALLLPAGADDGLLARLFAEPSIRTVVAGCRSGWWTDPLLPHDGFLGEFLMETRGYVDGLNPA